MNPMNALRPALLLALFGAPTLAVAQVPQRISVSGHLSDDAGAPITGAVALTLRLYTEAEGGAALAEERFDLAPAAGEFAVELGAAAPIDLATLSAGGVVYLGVQLDDDPEMSPRLRFNASLYAQQAYRAHEATTLQGAGPEDFALTEHTHDYASITGAPTELPAAPHGHDFAELTGVPATFPPAAHGHDYADLTGVPAAFPPAAHGHDWAELTGVPADLRDGDSDALASLACADGEGPVRSGAAWTCGATSSLADVVVTGAENNGTQSALRVTSTNQTMYIDGNEIETAGTLYLQNNSGASTHLGGDLHVVGDVIPNRGATPPEGVPGKRLHRYFSTIDGARRARNVSVNEVDALCGDADGCTIVLIERGFDAARPDLRRSTGVFTMYYEATSGRFSVDDGTMNGVAGDGNNLRIREIGQCSWQADWGSFPFAIRSGTATTRCYLSIED